MSGSGVQFTETMRGFAPPRPSTTTHAGFDRGKADDSPLEFTVTVTADDVDALVDEREHEADLAGTVTAPALSPTPLKVEGGRFNLLVRDAEHAAARQMLYSMPLVADDGRRFLLEGFKQIHRRRRASTSGRTPPPSTSPSTRASARVRSRPRASSRSTWPTSPSS